MLSQELTPLAIARAVSLLGRDAVGGDVQAHIARERLLDAYAVEQGLSRTQAVVRLTEIEIEHHLNSNRNRR